MEAGRKAWYNKVKEPNEAAWEAEEPPVGNQKWTAKLTKIVNMGIDSIIPI